METQMSVLKRAPVRWRIYVYLFLGVSALSSILYWQTSLFKSVDYYEVPIKKLKVNYSSVKADLNLVK